MCVGVWCGCVDVRGRGEFLCDARTVHFLCTVSVDGRRYSGLQVCVTVHT